MNTTNAYTYKTVTYEGDGMIRVPYRDVKHVSAIRTNAVRANGGEPVEDDVPILVPVTWAHLLSPFDTPPEDSWWAHCVTQSQFVHEYPDSAVVMKLPEDDTYLVTGKHMPSFVSWLRGEGHQVVFSRPCGGYVVYAPEWGLETNRAMNVAGVVVTPYASQWISPVTPQSVQLTADAAQAAEDGFVEPRKELFPSGRTLMPHQLPVSQVLAWRGQGIIADDVGSGKSSMFINGFFIRAQHMYDTGQVDDVKDCFPLVIVTKKSLVQPTQRECEVWLDDVKTCIVRGNKPVDIDPDVDVIICQLTSLDKHVREIVDMHPQGVVFDESHQIKNPSTIRAKAAMRLAEWIKENNAHPYVVCASATPMPNRPAELYSQLEITGMADGIMDDVESRIDFPSSVRVKNPQNKTFWNRKMTRNMRFEQRFCDGKSGPFGWEAKGSCHEEELSRLLRTHGMIRRKKSEFMTPLPPLRQRFIYCDLSEEDKVVYTRAQEEFRDHIVVSLREKAEAEHWSKNQLREAIIDKLYKANSSEAIMKMSELRYLVSKMKIPATVKWINGYFAGDPEVVGENITHHDKLLVFSHHREAQKMLRDHPDLQKHGVLYIGAGTKNVNEVIDQFQDPDSGKNLLVLYSNATDGLTLTASYAVFVLEIPFVPSTLIQMAGRCWARYSDLYAPHDATLYLSTSDTGIDRYLEDMVKNKSILSKTIIDGEQAMDSLNSLDDDDCEQYDSTADIMRLLLRKNG